MVAILVSQLEPSEQAFIALVPKRLNMKYSLDNIVAQRFQNRSRLKMLRTEPVYPICAPGTLSSGELKTVCATHSEPVFPVRQSLCVLALW